MSHSENAFKKEYDENADWRVNCGSVVDIGSGDGSFTSKFLTKYLPDNCKSIVGYDVSEEMVQYANDNHGSKNVTFKVLNISEPILKEDSNKFDQAFSFFVIHRSREQRNIFRNIFDLLTPGGGCFLVFLGRIPSVFETFRILHNTTKWKPWLSDVENIISPYHDSVDPVAEIQQIMTDVGFTDIKVSLRKTTHTFKSVEDAQACATAAYHFPIPEDKINEYVQDFIRTVRENGFISHNYEVEFNILIARGKRI